MDRDTKYLVATFSDGTIYKIPALIIINKLIKYKAQDLGVTVGMLSLNMEKVEDHQILSYAQALDYHFLMADAVKLTRKEGLYFKEGWPSSTRTIKTQHEIDNMKVEKEVPNV